MTGLRIVPSVATEEMVEAANAGHGSFMDDCMQPEHYAAAIAAAPALTDEQIRALAKLYNADQWYWKDDLPRGFPINQAMADKSRDLAINDIARMRAFILAITNGA